MPNESVLSTIAIVARQREASRGDCGAAPVRGAGFVASTAGLAASRNDISMTAPGGSRPTLTKEAKLLSGPGTAPERVTGLVGRGAAMFNGGGGGGGTGGGGAGNVSGNGNDLEGALVISRPSNPHS